MFSSNIVGLFIVILFSKTPTKRQISFYLVGFRLLVAMHLTSNGPTNILISLYLVGFLPVIPVFYLRFHIIKSNSFHSLLEQLVKHCNYTTNANHRKNCSKSKTKKYMSGKESY